MKIFTRIKSSISDTITPIRAYLALRDEFANVSLFESRLDGAVDSFEKDNMKSFIGVDPLVTFKLKDHELAIFHEGKLQRKVSVHHQSEFQNIINEYTFDLHQRPELNGCFGVFSHSSIEMFESIKISKKNKNLPEAYFAIYRFVLVFDQFKNELTVLQNSFDKIESENKLSRVIRLLYQSIPVSIPFETIGEIKINETEQEFIQNIQLAKKNILRGDVFQLVLSRQFSQKFKGDALAVYRQLRSINPSPYMFFFDFENGKLLGASPEAQIKVTDGKAEIHPIAGTVPRTRVLQEDTQNVAALIADPKENAEHTMLVDLARNDLNRSCSQVEVEVLKEVQAFSHVFHLVSKVTGIVEEVQGLDVFAGSFPAGTLCGAPKYRSLELIDQYESVSRGFYGGAIGHFAANGNMNFAIIIRSATVTGDEIVFQAGAGIVQDSLPQNELQEVYNKTRAIQKAIQLANEKI